MRGIGSIVLTALGLSTAATPIVLDPSPPAPPRRSIYRRPKGDFDPRINRWTGKPHEHKREIARRLRQQGEG